MGHLIAGNRLNNQESKIHLFHESDTIVASKEWVKENLDKVKEWANAQNVD